MDAMEKARTPGPQHAFLAEQAGTWKVTMKLWSDPAAPPAVSQATVERTMILGGRVLQETLEGELMGMPYVSVGQIGYDNVTGEHWTTATDNMGTGVFFMTGSLDAETGRGTFEGLGSAPELGRQIPIRHEIRIEAETQTIDLYMPGPDGGSVKVMAFVYERS